MTSPTMYYYTQVMNNLFKEYEKVEQISDFWNVSVKKIASKFSYLETKIFFLPLIFLIKNLQKCFIGKSYLTHLLLISVS